MEIVHGSHCFTIHDLSLTKRVRVGIFMASDIFTVAGHRWAILVYPCGKSVQDNPFYISAFIAAVSSDIEAVPALFELSLLGQSTTLLDQSTNTARNFMTHLHTPHRSPTPKILNKGQMWGVNRLCPRAYVEKLGFLKISCNVHVVVARTQSKKLYSISDPSPNLGEDLGALLDTTEGDATFGDVTFEVEGKAFRAHKLVLAARSPVFKSQLYGPMRCESSGKIIVEDIVAPVFKAMLHFIYKDVLPDTSDVESIGSSSSSSTLIAQHLFVAADRYGLNRLRLLCESKLSEDMTIDTVTTTLILAEQHHAAELKAHCLRYASGNLREVMLSEGFKHLQNSYPHLEREILIIGILDYTSDAKALGRFHV